MITHSQVYIYTMMVFVLIYLCLFVLARFSPNQYEDPGDRLGGRVDELFYHFGSHFCLRTGLRFYLSSHQYQVGHIPRLVHS